MNRFTEIFGFGKARYLNLVLLTMVTSLLVWVVSICLRPIPEPLKPKPAEVKNEVAKEEIEKPEPASYAVIVERDLFRETRRKPVPKPVAKPVPPPPPPPPPKRPPPKLVLVGTILMSDGNKAVIDYNGRRNYFGIGDSIEEFVIKEIENSQILLDRDGEALRVNISPNQ